MKRITRWRQQLAGFAVCAMMASPAAAGSCATVYDMRIFLDQSNPFDTAAPVAQLQPIASASAADGGTSLVDDEFGDDEFGDIDGLDDLAPQSAEGDVNDPLEPVNRFIFGFNQIVEDVILRPFSYGYHAVVPEFGRTAISNFLDNLSGPVVLANDLLQGEPGRAWTTTRRLLINTTIGVGGLWDVAASFGIDEHREDFGQTMGVWGVSEGPYLMLPILGPSNSRDVIGKFGDDPFFNPVGMYLMNTNRHEGLIISPFPAHRAVA